MRARTHVHTVVSITRAWCLARRSEINETQAQKKKEVSSQGKERREREREGRKKDDIKMWKWRHDVLEAVDSHEVDPTRIVPHVSMVFSFAGGGPRPPRFFRNLSSTRPLSLLTLSEVL